MADHFEQMIKRGWVRENRHGWAITTKGRDVAERYLQDERGMVDSSLLEDGDLLDVLYDEMDDAASA